MYYNILSDAKKNQGHSWYTAQAEPYCDTGVSGDWKGNGWYRFVEPAGTQMADSDPSGKIHLKNPKIMLFNAYTLSHSQIKMATIVELPLMDG